MPTQILAGLIAESAIQLGPVHHHLGERDSVSQLTDQARRVKGRTAGQLITINQHDVSPTEQRQVIRNARASHSSTDDDCPSLCAHESVI
jgi:hypothetical protein